MLTLVKALTSSSARPTNPACSDRSEAAGLTCVQFRLVPNAAHRDRRIQQHLRSISSSPMAAKEPASNTASLAHPAAPGRRLDERDAAAAPWPARLREVLGPTSQPGSKSRTVTLQMQI